MTIYDRGIDFGNAPEPPRKETTVDKAADLLLSLLAKGPVETNEIKTEFEGAGLSWYSARQAKEELNIVAVKQNTNNKWAWSLPARENI